MSRTHHRRKRTPPRRLCRECGTHVYSWVEAPLCSSCTAKLPTTAERAEPEHESLRAFRQRVIDPDRNAK